LLHCFDDAYFWLIFIYEGFSFMNEASPVLLFLMAVCFSWSVFVYGGFLP